MSKWDEIMKAADKSKSGPLEVVKFTDQPQQQSTAPVVPPVLGENIFAKKLKEQDQAKSESRIQAEAFLWFWNTYPALRGLLYHVPNGEYRDEITASKLKAMGVVAGIPDIVFHYRRKTWFFEFKDEKGKLSKAQEEIHNVMRAQGFTVYIVRDVPHFQKTVVDIIENPQTDPYRVGLTRDEFYYRYNIFNYIYTKLAHNELVKLEDLVEPINRIKFTEHVQEFIAFRYDEKAGFELLFTTDMEAIYKRDTGKPWEPIFYNGKSIVE